MLPPAFVAVMVTEYVPALEYRCTGFLIVLLVVLPSPKIHNHDVGVFVELSVNVTVKGRLPDVGVPLNPATGGGRLTVI